MEMYEGWIFVPVVQYQAHRENFKSNYNFGRRFCTSQLKGSPVPQGNGGSIGNKSLENLLSIAGEQLLTVTVRWT